MSNPRDSEKIVTATKAATILGTSDGMLSHWRKTGQGEDATGPKYTRTDNGKFLYQIGDLIAWSQGKVDAEEARHVQVSERAKIELGDSNGAST